MKHKKKLFGLGIGMAAAIALGSAPAKQASAAAVGYINITKITYLYNWCRNQYRCRCIE